MRRSVPPTTTNGAEEDINAILEAERQSAEQLTRNREEAEAVMSDARALARRIQERADSRSMAMRSLCQRTTAARLSALRDETQAVRSRAVQTDARENELARAVARLAAELTGGEP